jgi:O-antigen/teichoic acid export membrane protein
MKASRVVSSVIFNYSETIFSSATGFVYTAFMLRHLSRGDFGILALMGSLLSYAGLLNIGVGLTAMKMIAERANNDTENEIPRIVGSALILFGVLGVIAVGVALSIEPFAGSIFHVGGASEHTFRIAFAIAIPSIVLVLPSSLYTAVHQAYQDYRYIAILGMVVQTIDVGVGITLLLLGYGVVPLMILGTSQIALVFACKVIHAHRKFGLRPEVRHLDMKLGRTMMGTSVWVMLLNIASQSIYSSDVIVVGAVLGTADAASYQVALGPALGLKAISDQFSPVSFSAAASLRGQQAHEELRRLLSEATRVAVAVVTPGVIVFVLWGRRLIELWAGKNYMTSYETLSVLSFAMLIAALQGTSAQLLFALNRYKKLAVIGLAEAAINIGLSIILAKHLGIIGVAWGTAIPITVMTLGIYVPMACKLVGIRFTALLRRLVLPLVVNGALYISLRFTIGDGHIYSNLVALLVASVGVFVVSFSLSILLDSKERNTYIGMVKSALVRIKS